MGENHIVFRYMKPLDKGDPELREVTFVLVILDTTLELTSVEFGKWFLMCVACCQIDLQVVLLALQALNKFTSIFQTHACHIGTVQQDILSLL